ncbi:MAG: hypothetical protein WBN00_08085 [Sedimenticolaceae bacterium]
MFIPSNRNLVTAIVAVFIVSLSSGSAFAYGNFWPGSDLDKYEWTEVNPDASWEARAGLQVVELRNRLYLMGGRTPIDPAIDPSPGASIIWGDVWKSRDKGTTWSKILDTDDEGHWPARAYFQAVTRDRHMYVLGGQNFNVDNPACPPFPSNCPPKISKFFNDVWRSRDGVRWKLMTENAGWAGRAGLSAVVLKGAIYVMGGSFNDDPAVIGGPPERVYFNDVWRSSNGGRSWVRLTEHAPWAPRAGAVAVKKNGYIYLIGGEDGFTCDSGGERCPPYFNDVWRTRDGFNWELVTEAAPWSPRPGHQVVVLKNHFVLFGGFGLSDDPADPFKPSNPTDMWISRDGEEWWKALEPPWLAYNPADIKYDFDALVLRGGRFGSRKPAIYTFGGDRETFNFFDPFNYLNVDNDVWSFSPPPKAFFRKSHSPAK